jgi:hypothetical protein
MAHTASSIPKLATTRTQSATREREGVDREDLKVQILLGSVALGSLALSLYSILHPFG